MATDLVELYLCIALKYDYDYDYDYSMTMTPHAVEKRRQGLGHSPKTLSAQIIG